MAAPTRAALIALAARQLARAGIEAPVREARLLCRWAAGLDGAALAARLDELPDAAEHARFARALEERVARRPIAQIIGQREFWGRVFRVTPAVLDPRPESELLIERALAGTPPSRILDLGTGSGCLLLTLLAEWPRAEGLGVDVSPAALAVAEANARALGLSPRARFALSDWGEGIDERFDLVVANPPYVAEGEFASLDPEVRKYEPHLALSGGPDGLDAYRRIAADLPRILAAGGRVLFEIGAHQARAVCAILLESGLDQLGVHRDLGGHDRVVEAALRQIRT